MTHRRVMEVAVFVAIFAVEAAVGFGVLSPWQREPGALTASGTLEADEVLIAPRVSALVTALPYEAGATVHAGATVARLDDRTLQLQIRQTLDPATRHLLELQAGDYELAAPIAGVVTRAPGHVGEMAFPGQTLLAVSDLSRLRVTLYVRAVDIARVELGQEVSLVVDAYPDRAFTGIVTSISQHAEFTPRNVQTQADRQNLVFGVQATVPNPDGALKPGMAADATFAPLTSRPPAQ